MTTLWLKTDKGDPDARRLVDGEVFGLEKPHYSRQQPGTPSFTRNGQNLVFLTPDLRSVWVTFRPTPGKAERMDGLDAWECALFRNEGPYKASELIIEAEELTAALWGRPPKDGFITFIRRDKVRPTMVRGAPVWGWTYLKAGWEFVGLNPKGYLMFRAPPRSPPPRPHWAWGWKGERGGKLRRQLDDIHDLIA